MKLVILFIVVAALVLLFNHGAKKDLDAYK